MLPVAALIQPPGVFRKKKTNKFGWEANPADGGKWSALNSRKIANALIQVSWVSTAQ
jgi:hypothetical protein